MKTSFYLTAFCVIALSIFLIWKKYEIYEGNIAISVNENEGTYKFSAVYDANNTAKVQSYINNKISPNGLFQSVNDYLDVSTTLTDKTQFHVKESPGKLKIELDKRKNTYGSYIRIKKMCEGIKSLLAGK
jgi:hypothetical protein